MEEQHAAAEAEGQAISGMVDQEDAGQLQAMGYSKNVSEKALFMVQGAGVEAAIEWIESHSSDPDFEEEHRVRKRAAQSKSGSSTGEAAKQAREIQKKLKQQQDEEEKQLKLERERDQIRVERETIEQRNHEEVDNKRFEEQRKKEEQDQKFELRRMHEILRQDKKARIITDEERRAKEKTPDEKMKLAIRTIKTLYTRSTQLGIASTAFRILRDLASNLANDPEDDNCKRIDIKNVDFHERVGKLTGGITFLNAIGFAALEEGFINTDPNVTLLNEAVRLLDEAIEHLG
jgi:hypothetical protein